MNHGWFSSGLRFILTIAFMCISGARARDGAGTVEPYGELGPWRNKGTELLPTAEFQEIPVLTPLEPVAHSKAVKKPAKKAKLSRKISKKHRKTAASRRFASRPKDKGLSVVRSSGRTYADISNQRSKPEARLIGPSGPTAEIPRDAVRKSVVATQKGSSSSVNKAIIESPREIGINEKGEDVESSSNESVAEVYSNNSRTSDYEHIAFSSTHLLPSPRTLNRGQVVVGSVLSLGVVEGLEVSTDLTRNYSKFYNISAKAPIVEFSTFVASGFVTFESFRFDGIDVRNPNGRVNSWQPGLVTGYEINPDLALFLGGAVRLASNEVPRSFVQSGWMRGSRLMADLGWKYNRNGSKWSENALSTGLSADLSYKLIGAGVTHHWEKFTIGMHYMVNADRQRLLPMLAFQSSLSF